ncbi:MAG TPA: response regulator [Verrucomicrobiae bacterium]|nr:response regulator [Verrucomicrobiae bacterium]
MKDQKKTILFIEDDPLILTIYRSRLEREGFHVEVAPDGLAALEKLPEIRPCLVILDLMLPMLDGIDVLKFIRDDSDLKATPVLILSNAYMDDRATRAMKAGANKCFPKTQCTPAKLMAAVHEVLGISPENITLHGFKREEVASALAKADEVSLKKTRDELIKDAPSEINKIREHCLAYVKNGGAPDSAKHLNELYQNIRFFAGRAGLGDCTRIAHLAAALEAMLFEIIFKSATPSPSALQTIAQAVDCLGRLFELGDIEFSETTLKAKVLVVDDDPVCTFATTTALKRARLEAVSAEEPAVGLKMAQAETYDIVLLDINMPGLNGFEVCKQLRLLPNYKDTPVIFVTSSGDFQSKAQSVLSGGNDLITKPISPLELTLKTVMHLIEPNGRAVHATARHTGTSGIPPIPAAVISFREIKPEAPDGHGALKAVPPVPAGTFTGRNDIGTGNRDRFASPIHRNTPVPAPKIKPPALKLCRAKLSSVEPFKNNRITLPFNGDQQNTFMKNPTTESMNKLVVEVARIIFGDDALSEMNVRLTRIALDRYNVPQILGTKSAESLNDISREISRIVFGDEQISEMHQRLMRIALERYNVPEILGQTDAVSQNGHSDHTPGVVVNL